MPFCTLKEAWGTDFETFTNPPLPSEVAVVEEEQQQQAVVVVEPATISAVQATIAAVPAPIAAVPAVTLLNDTVRNEMDLMNKKIDSLIRRLESQPAPQDFFNKNIHDIILFIIFGLFLILVLDGMYKILLLKLNRVIN